MILQADEACNPDTAACSFYVNFQLLQRVKQSLTVSQGTLLACLRGGLPVNSSQGWSPGCSLQSLPKFLKLKYTFFSDMSSGYSAAE